MGSSTGAAGRGESKSPRQSSKKQSPPRQEKKTDTQSDARDDGPLKPTTATINSEPSSSSNAEATKPLAPPPRPNQQQQQQQQQNNSPDYFSNPPGVGAASLSLEPNPFEQSFGGGAPETPGGTKLPSVAALTSPSSLLPGTGATPFGWPGSLRTGPLSPAMLSGPTNDYFSDTHHIRGGFPTPNESSLRTGLTPGGSGSMFPAPSPNTALFGGLAGGVQTPSTLEFHRTALSVQAKREPMHVQQPPAPPVTSAPQEMSNGSSLKAEVKPPTNSYDTHDNDAANGLYMLAQARSGTQPPPPSQYATIPPAQVHAHANHQPAPAVQPINTSPQMNGHSSIGGSSARGVSETGSAMSDESEQARPVTRAKGKRGSTSAAGTRRKADDGPAKGPANKKAKTNGGPPPSQQDFDDQSEDEDHHINKDGTKTKMTDEEKRKNFLERNRVAALKCRQRKKQWLANLQSKVEEFSQENENLTHQISVLREEVVNLKTLLLAHKDCPVTQSQQQGNMHPGYIPPPLEYNPQMAAYGMPGGMPPNPPAVMAAHTGGRRFS
ncbi:Aft1 HRA domain-containing protein [Triangularia verruculosa]|uniref:Aft1 HRA domain-containing protein n=1 Tax=Triangularia verruculosa TaxID=2587418 RepID=A0AAN6XJZ5_9PEZI|nr:Aft1 HRA domain-containing protein [Triangularia verruculosa]